jgi:hypothetical protein
MSIFQKFPLSLGTVIFHQNWRIHQILKFLKIVILVHCIGMYQLINIVCRLGLRCLMSLSTIFQLYCAISFIGGGNRSTLRKPLHVTEKLYSIMLYRVWDVHNIHTYLICFSD